MSYRDYKDQDLRMAQIIEKLIAEDNRLDHIVEMLLIKLFYTMEKMGSTRKETVAILAKLSLRVLNHLDEAQRTDGGG